MVGRYGVLCSKRAIYLPARKEVELTTRGARLSMELKPNFGVLEVTSDPPVRYQLDGDPFGTLPVTVGLVPRAVQVIVPEPTRWGRMWQSVKSRSERRFSAARGRSR